MRLTRGLLGRSGIRIARPPRLLHCLALRSRHRREIHEIRARN